MPMTEAAIESRIHGDLYVQMGEVIQGDTWLVRIWVKPFVSWVWFGCLMMGLGGLLAVTDKRYRVKVRAGATEASRAVSTAR
jgi:cytochrome c-type biogenesis protein CcmF